MRYRPFASRAAAGGHGRMLIVLAAACWLAAGGAGAETRDWPQWMGPAGNGAAFADGVFGAAPRLVEAWRRPIGSGYSSISVVGGRGYTMSAEGEQDVVLAFDAATGKDLWRYPVGAMYEGHDGSHDGPLSTPTVDAGRVFAISPRGGLFALDAERGTLLWSKDLAAELDAQKPYYGTSTAPLVVGDRLVVLAGGRGHHNLVAFDKASGELAWSTHHAERPTYASPVLAGFGGRHLIVGPAADRVYAVDAGDGSLLWQQPTDSQSDRNPLVVDDRHLFLPLPNDGVMLAVGRAGEAWKVEELWRSVRLKNSFSPAVVHAGAVFGMNGRFLTCLDAASGEVRWRQRMDDGAVILVDGHLVFLGRNDGALRVIAANPEAFEVRTSLEVLGADATAFSPPSFAGGRVFVRNLKEMVAVDVAAGAGAESGP